MKILKRSKYLLLLLLLSFFITTIAQETNTPLNDLSGLTWVGGNNFIGLHDVKGAPDDEKDFRISLVTIPGATQDHVAVKALYPEYIDDIPLPCDLESACRIPGDQGFLFCESGQCWGGEKRIFHVDYVDGNIEFITYIDWPVEVSNVEASEVFSINDRLVFIYAERAQGEQSTYIRWAPISLEPLSIGPFQEIQYKSKMSLSPDFRPVVGMDIDDEGKIYIASSYDPGIDAGPFKSAVWQIGHLATDKDGRPVVKLKKGRLLGTMDGLKIESLSIIETDEGKEHIYFGTDDEHHKGIIRMLP